jgi:hypothetical protein
MFSANRGPRLEKLVRKCPAYAGLPDQVTGQVHYANRKLERAAADIRGPIKKEKVKRKKEKVRTKLLHFFAFPGTS